MNAGLFRTYLVFIPIMFLGCTTLAPRAQRDVASTDEILQDLSALAPLSTLSMKNPMDYPLKRGQNVAEFCRINGYRDLWQTSEMETGVRMMTPSDGWKNNFVASYDFREASFLDFFSAENRGHGLVDEGKGPLTFNFQAPKGYMYSSAMEPRKQRAYDYILSYLRSYDGKKSVEFYKSRFTKLITTMMKDGAADQKKDYDAGFLQSSFVCMDFGVINAVSCARGLGRVQEIAKPVRSTTLIGVWRDVLSDSNYIAAFQIVATKLVTQLKNHQISSTRLFDDMKDAFVSLGLSPEQAQEYAWNSMGFFATGGANTHLRIGFMELDDPSLRGENDDGSNIQFIKDNIFVVTNAALVMDRLTVKKGFLYSYPKEVDIDCDYGKDYHFWMTAYLAHRLVLEKFSPEIAASASYSAQKGYQFAKVGEGRDPMLPFKTTAFTNYNNNMRLDLTQAAAGAWFGATSLSRSLQVSRSEYDNALYQVFEGSKQLPPVAAKEFPSLGDVFTMQEFYKNWKAILNSDQPYLVFQQKSGY